MHYKRQTAIASKKTPPQLHIHAQVSSLRSIDLVLVYVSYLYEYVYVFGCNIFASVA